jgi:hypothetical protein
MPKLDFLSNVLLIVFDLLLDTLRFIRVSLQPRCALAAEKLFLREQLALYLERIGSVAYKHEGAEELAIAPEHFVHP